jgi:hypothetical protein
MNANFARLYATATEDEKVRLDERAATLEYDAGYLREQAEAMAAREFSETPLFNQEAA